MKCAHSGRETTGDGFVCMLLICGDKAAVYLLKIKCTNAETVMCMLRMESRYGCVYVVNQFR